MAGELEPIDVTNTPELLRLAQEVRRSGARRVLRRDREGIAVVMPVSPRTRRPAPKARTAADREAFLSAAEIWKNFDLDKFLRDNEESRRLSRPPVEP